MVKKKNRIKIAAIQMNVTGNQAENMKKICAFMEKASQEGVEVAVFPECALSGYPSSDQYRDIPSLKKVKPEAIEEDLNKIGKLSQKLSLWTCIGTARYRDNNWHNEALLISDEGEVKGVYNKVHLTKEDTKYFIRGNSLLIVKLKGIPVSLQICFDMRFPESWRILKDKGAKIIFHLVHASHNSSWKIPVLEGVMRTRASENGYFVISANDAGPLQMIQSIIVNPKGLKLAQANTDTEEMITANLNLKEVNSDFSKQRRLDLYEIKLKERVFHE